jgi:hypothetical protein
MPHRQELLPPILDQSVALHRSKLGQHRLTALPTAAIASFGALCATKRFGDDPVDDPQLLQILRRQPQASAASRIFSASFHRMLAQPSGEMTE